MSLKIEVKSGNKEFDPLGLVKRDALYIVLVVFALLACLYTLWSVSDYQEKCNAHWEAQLSKCDFMMTKNYSDFDEDFDFQVPWPGKDEDKDQDPYT